MPHYSSYQAAAPGASINWTAASTLIPCPGKSHVFNVQLLNGTTLVDTTTATRFL